MAIIAVFSATAGYGRSLLFSIALLAILIVGALFSQRYALFGLDVPKKVELDFQSVSQAKCIASGVESSDGNVISICAIRFHRELTYEGAISIIYDSTDEIGRIADAHPKEWIAALREISDQAPFAAFGFSASRITGHFYYVIFASYLTPLDLR